MWGRCIHLPFMGVWLTTKNMSATQRRVCAHSTQWWEQWETATHHNNDMNVNLLLILPLCYCYNLFLSSENFRICYQFIQICFCKFPSTKSWLSISCSILCFSILQIVGFFLKKWFFSFIFFFFLGILHHLNFVKYLIGYHQVYNERKKLTSRGGKIEKLEELLILFFYCQFVDKKEMFCWILWI